MENIKIIRVREMGVKYLKTIMVYLISVIVLAACQGTGLLCDNSDSNLNAFEPETSLKMLEPTCSIELVDCFEYAELVTGFSAEVLRGIAASESHFRVNAVGDGGMSLGMFQLHSRWHESRVEKWGVFDPTDPFESAVIAGRIMQENLTAFNGDMSLAIAAYRQGIWGVRKNGIIGGYAEEILSWRNDLEKVLSFFIFCGITDTEGLQDEYKNLWTQDTHKFDNSFAVQVSWRGSGGISY
jgi:hypothetical protein